MTHEKFKRLSGEMQQNWVMRKGVFLLDRTKDNYKVYLFSLDAFYVELFFAIGDSQLQFQCSFADLEALEPYLHMVDISELICLLK